MRIYKYKKYKAKIGKTEIVFVRTSPRWLSCFYKNGDEVATMLPKPVTAKNLKVYMPQLKIIGEIKK